MKNKLLGFIVLAICSFGLIAGVNAEEYPVVEDATSEDTYEDAVTVDVKDSETADVTVTVSAGTWKLLAEDPDQERPDGYAWVGLEFTMPEGSQNVKIGDDTKSPDGESKFTEYFGFNVDDIKEAVADLKENLTKDFTLSWQDADNNDYQQKIHIVIEFAKITIKDESTASSDPETPVWDETIYETAKKEAEESYAEIHTHKITIVTEHGKVEAPTTALMGTEVTLKITADKGYELDKIVVDDETVKVVDNKFTMPDKDVKITVTFKEVKTETDTEVDTETVVKPDTEVNENPSTFDGVVAYMILGTLALGLTLYVTNKICKKEN